MAAQHKRPGVLAGDPACAPGAKQKLGTAGGQSDAARCPSGKAKARGLATWAVCPEYAGETLQELFFTMAQGVAPPCEELGFAKQTVAYRHVSWSRLAAPRRPALQRARLR